MIHVSPYHNLNLTKPSRKLTQKMGQHTPFIGSRTCSKVAFLASASCHHASDTSAFGVWVSGPTDTSKLKDHHCSSLTQHPKNPRIFNNWMIFNNMAIIATNCYSMMIFKLQKVRQMEIVAPGCPVRVLHPISQKQQQVDTARPHKPATNFGHNAFNWVNHCQKTSQISEYHTLGC